MAVQLYHPELKETTEVPNELSASVLEKSGWTRDVPKKYQQTETESVAPATPQS